MKTVQNSVKFPHFLEQFGYELINLNVINLKKNSNKNNYLPNECDSVFSLQQNIIKIKGNYPPKSISYVFTIVTKCMMK